MSSRIVDRMSCPLDCVDCSCHSERSEESREFVCYSRLIKQLELPAWGSIQDLTTYATDLSQSIGRGRSAEKMDSAPPRGGELSRE